MLKILHSLAVGVILILLGQSLSFSETANITGLVDNFQKSTDLQREEMLKDTLGKETIAAGMVSNVGEYDFFDVVNDMKGIYYQLSLKPQKTPNNIPYQVIFLFKDRAEVKDIAKDQNFQKEGKIIRIIDERLQIAVWLYCGELTEKDKALFKQSN